MPIDATRPSSSKKTAAELEAELAAMEAEEAAEDRRRQEREEKKKTLAELAEAKKVEEAAAAAAAVRKAARKAAKRRAETQEENVEAPAAKKQKATDEVDGGEELAREACRRCVAISSELFLVLNFLLDAICKRLTAFEPRDREARPASLVSRSSRSARRCGAIWRRVIAGFPL